ncbi:hypothetical protein B0J14DRAFT_597128 [Halenospora varia]|nr:hypothetical protein B0J14DRAFT_597128 [Halenospora varia]
MVPDQTASWDFETGSKKIKLSKIAVSILNESGMLGQKDLRLHKPKPIFIDNRRWDPVTAVSSASIAIAGEVVDGAVGIFTKPYEEYKRSQTNPRTSSENQHPLISTPHPSESASGAPPTAFPTPTSKKKNSKSTASAMATASATSLGKLAVSLSKGTLVVE